MVSQHQYIHPHDATPLEIYILTAIIRALSLGGGWPRKTVGLIAHISHQKNGTSDSAMLASLAATQSLLIMNCHILGSRTSLQNQLSSTQNQDGSSCCKIRSTIILSLQKSRAYFKTRGLSLIHMNGVKSYPMIKISFLLSILEMNRCSRISKMKTLPSFYK